MTALRHTMSAFAAVALVCALAGSPVLAGDRQKSGTAQKKEMYEYPGAYSSSSASKLKTPKGLATKKDGKEKGLDTRFLLFDADGKPLRH
jgi:hypothetical protein